ncbi:MAG: hypothetical protein RSC28_05495 [Bacteroidales bacterium]
MGIRKKISLGFVVIGTVLLLSSLIAIYELISMRKSVSSLITDNIASINTSRLLLEVTDEYNFKLLKGMGADSAATIPDLKSDVRFSDYLNEVKGKFTTEQERNVADSVLYAYTAYIHIMNEAPYVWLEDYQGRRNWYFNKLYPVYMKLRTYIQSLTEVSQKALAENSQNLSESFYRSIMPGVVAVSIGIVLVFLFNYFINFYFIRPILLISRGIGSYLQYRKSYNVKIDNDDELKDLSNNVKELIDTNKNLTKQND